MSFERINELLAFKRGVRTLTDDTDEVLIIRYIGAAVDGAVTVAVADATGDISFVVDGAADTTVATTGTIDVSDAAYNTFGEVVDAINASPNWKAYIKDGLRSETSTDALLTFAAANAKTADIVCYGDTSVKLSMDCALTLEKFNSLDEIASNLPNVAKVFGITATSTYASGTSKIQIYSVDMDGTETKIYEVAGGATTVAGSTTSTSGWKPTNLDCSYKLVARLINSAAMASVTMIVDGANANYTLA